MIFLPKRRLVLLRATLKLFRLSIFNMMQNFGLEDLSHVQSRHNLSKYLFRVEMASDWFTRFFGRTNFLENRDMACKLGCGLFLSPQSIRNENQTKVNTVLIGTKFGNKGAKIKKIRGLRFRVLVFGS